MRWKSTGEWRDEREEAGVPAKGHSLKLGSNSFRTMTRKFYLTRSISLLPAG